MSKSPEDFETIEVISKDGLVMVELEYIGEGYSGDYDPEDDEDDALLRYSIYRKYQQGDDENKVINLCDTDAYEDGDWMAVSDASYCTHLLSLAPRNQLKKAAKFILSQVESNVRDYKRTKRLYEQLSWIRLEKGNIVCNH